MKSEREIEKEFYERFNALGLEFQVIDKPQDIRASRPFTRSYPYDISIQIGGRQVALIEFKTNLSRDIDLARLEQFALANSIRIAAVSDGEEFIVSDERTNTRREKLQFQEFLELLQYRSDISINSSKQRIAATFRATIEESEFTFLKQTFLHHPKHITRNLEFDPVAELFFLKNPTKLESVENQIFRALLRNEHGINRVYRYTSLGATVATLTRSKYRMNCVVGMNDPSEVNYAENYITGTNRAFALARWQTVSMYNRRFISSCSQKSDDLTQWRLYADNSKGVCLALKIDVDRLNSNFVAEQISYAKPDGSHPELDLIKQLIAKIKGMGVNFVFKTLRTWRHFFKPVEYEVEHEVRILHIAKASATREWFLTSSNNILNPCVEFDLADPTLPMRIDEIVLGPNCPEKEINLRQMEELVREIRKTNLQFRPRVRISDITTYR